MDKPEVKVLLIEDDPSDRMAFERIVEDETLPYRYFVAGSILEAKRYLNSEPFDVVITNSIVGDETVLALFDFIIDAPILMMTEDGHIDIAVQAMKLGAYDYLIKDADRHYLKVLPMNVERAVRHKTAEDRLRESEERYRILFHSAADPIAVIDTEGNLFDVNQRFEEESGYSRHEILGRNIYTCGLLTGKSIKKIKPHVKGLLQGRSCPLLEIECVSKDSGLVPYELRAVPIKRNGEIISIQAILRNIAERAEAERERMRMQAQLIQAQKMEAIGVLAGGIAHDFNNLLTAIIGCTDMAMMGMDASESAYMDLKEVRIAAERAADLTSQLMLFSRKKNMRFTPVDLNAVVRDLLKMLHRLIGEDIRIDTDLSSNLWAGWADQGTIGQVIMNLAVNARDAMLGGGELRIRTSNTDLKDKQCRHMSEAYPGKFVCLSVSDSGVGMDEKTIAHAFDPFFSTKQKGKGTGLGLAVVYGIVKQHAGWIHVKSKPGFGSTFEVYIPRCLKRAKKEGGGIRIKEQFQGGGKRILIVEDEDKVREFTACGLDRSGYVVFSAANASEAKSVFSREKGDFHLILSDIMLPDKNGIELVDEFISAKPDLRVLFSSGYSDYHTRWPMLQERGCRFLEKPYTLCDLLSTIQELTESLDG